MTGRGGGGKGVLSGVSRFSHTPFGGAKTVCFICLEICYNKHMKLVVLFLAVAMPVWAQFSVEEMMKPCAYTNEEGEVFLYRANAPQFPEAGKKYPLILFLHGSGECGTDNLHQMKIGLPVLLGSLLKCPEKVIVIAPQCQMGNWWVRRVAFDPDYTAARQPSGSLEVALELCRSYVASGLADSNRVYITGLSLGGSGTWDAIQRADAPVRFAAAIPICGNGDVRRVRVIRDLPIWVFHGRVDKNVPVACSRRLVEALKQAGNRSVRYTEYENGAHDVWNQVYNNPDVIAWLLEQNLSNRRPWWRFW